MNHLLAKNTLEVISEPRRIEEICSGIGEQLTGLAQMVSHQATAKDDVPYEFTDRRVTYDVAAWNIQRISQCKIELCFEQNYDLMALTELGDRPHDAWEFGLKYPGRIMCSDPSLPTDPAAGAAILLSGRDAA